MKNKALYTCGVLILATTMWATGWISARVYFSDRIENGSMQTTSEETESMIVLINRERRAAGLPTITLSQELVRAAKYKACDMKERNYFDHADPDGNKGWYLIDEQGLSWNHAGENLAKGNTSPENVMKNLMKSPTHKANILGTKFNQVGYATCGEYTAQFFTD